MRYLKLSENQNKGNDIAVNEYGERIAPKPEKSENTARNNASANNRSYSRYQKPFRRPALPPKGFPPQLSAGSRLKMQTIITIM